jgi:hypothetical protein
MLAVVALALFLAAPARATVSTTTSVVEYTCNGTLKTFTVPFRFLAQEHLRVSRVQLADPYTETVLPIASIYTVGGAGSATGGVVSLVTPSTGCATGYKLRIRRLTPKTQGTALSTQGPYNPKALEAMADRQAMIAQELNDGSLIGNRWFDFTVQGPPDQALVTAAGSTVPRSLAARAADVVSVRDFGAVGDGVTDDTAAIQAAVNFVTTTAWAGSVSAMYAKGGGTVYFPAGVYRITSTVLLGGQVRLLGITTRGFQHPAQLQTITDLAKQKASVIYADFANANQWAFASATYTAATGVLRDYKSTSTGSDVDNGIVNVTEGIEVANLFFRSGATPVYGAVKLSAAPDSRIVSCGAYGFKIGYWVSASWAWQIENSWSLTHWYGVFASVDVNAASVSGYFNRITGGTAIAGPAAGDVPVYPSGDELFAANYQLKATGIYLSYSMSFDLHATAESWDVGAQLLHANGNVSWLHTERSGTVAVAAFGAQLHVDYAYNYSATPVPTFDIGQAATVTVSKAAGNPTKVFGHVNQYSTVYAGFSIAADDWSSHVFGPDQAGTWYVSGSGSDTNSGLDSSHPFASITQAFWAMTKYPNQKDWRILIADGSALDWPVATAPAGARIIIDKVSTGSNPTLTASNSSGNAYPLQLVGDSSLIVNNMAIAMNSAAPYDAYDKGFVALTNAQARVTFKSCTIDLTNGYAIFRPTYATANTLSVVYESVTISGTSGALSAAVYASAGAMSVVSQQYGSTAPAAIKTAGYGAPAVVITNNFI